MYNTLWLQQSDVGEEELPLSPQPHIQISPNM